MPVSPRAASHGRKAAAPLTTVSTAGWPSGVAHGADGANDGLQLNGPGLGAAEDAAVAGQHVGLGWHQDEVQVELCEARPQRGELHVQADDDGDPQALPRDDVDRGTGGEEEFGAVQPPGCTR